jgi:hypothetical protein
VSKARRHNGLSELKKIRITGPESLYDVETTHIQTTWQLFQPHGTRYAKEIVSLFGRLTAGLDSHVNIYENKN